MGKKEGEYVGPYHVLSSSVKYSNPWLTLREDKVIRPGGAEGIFGVVDMLAGSTVIAIDHNQDVFLGEEYKYGIRRSSIELISGALDESETPLDAAKRELGEELGLEAGNWTELGVVDPFTTVISSPNYIFMATSLKQIEKNLDDGEIVSLMKVPFKEALAMVLESKITHSASCVAILKAARVLGI